jgi:hypothetical protein
MVILLGVVVRDAGFAAYKMSADRKLRRFYTSLPWKERGW